MDIGETIKDLRRKDRKRLKHVSGQTGLSQSYLSSLETGARGASLKTLHRIAAAFNRRLVVSFEEIEQKAESFAEQFPPTEDEELIEKLADQEFAKAVLAEK